ncbi:MAG: Spy/CpxP family protein refolding chaperone [Gammaproteobacteria bacterium]|nr:Spy/CpxP family protein refolding chaperone [Gammaproteobacteria bacterium]MDH3370352.1 Spy/CpxP family protein refolding chaperone [Gammaproteobacteria bacterium]MDH3406529.1 Spy/CpxP family protein refolding chaperone [Gammaproteobacteria bacterium]MDH3562483.1 Spy/CpxP family protein refolding chaperone [Gammaproteobacteria bacterium]MDH5487128.1 Spy/CpxP family protein refolding chaperone [Gammaproteobacteria bacterium]
MIKSSSAVILTVFAFLNAASAAQPGPYAGQEQREIKALSSDEIQSYLAGKGAGFAKAAELNDYPGPAHVLELADSLQLSEEQKTRTQSIFDAMQKEAVRQGKVLVEKERELDRLFATGKVTEDSLRVTIREIGALQAEVRRAHLQAHLEQRAVLTKTQIAKYNELRGYASKNGQTHGGHSHGH